MIRFHAMTDAGKVRAHNEDAVFADGRSGVFAVADGVGGRAAGEVASALTIQTIEESIPTLRAVMDRYAADPQWEQRNDVINALDRVCQAASTRVYDEGERLGRKGMTTTVVVMLVTSGTAFFAHVGDSALTWCGTAVQRATEDHSMVNELVRSGQMTYAEARRANTET